MSDTHDERGGDEAASEVVGLLRSLSRTKITPETVTQHLIDRWYREKGEYLDEIRQLQKQLAATTARAAKWESVYRQLHDDRDQWQDAAVKAADERDAATARAESATVLPERWRALIAERDAAVRRAQEAEAERDELREYVAALNEAQISLQSSSFEVGWWKGFKAMPTAGVHTQVLLDTVEYADELRALNVAAAVAPDAAQEARSATETAEDTSGGAFQGNICSILPESLSGPQTCCTRHVHDGLMHICALAAGHDTHMCAEGDRWTTDDDTTEDDRG